MGGGIPPAVLPVAEDKEKPRQENLARLSFPRRFQKKRSRGLYWGEGGYTTKGKQKTRQVRFLLFLKRTI